MSGGDVREFVLDLGESLTTAIQQSGEQYAARQVLCENDALADEAVSYLGYSESDVRLTERSLRPPRPAAVILPELSEEQIALLDEQQPRAAGPRSWRRKTH